MVLGSEKDGATSLGIGIEGGKIVSTEPVINSMKFLWK